MKDILVPVSPGEMLDKITILRIKAARMSDAAKVANVKHELALLEKTWKDSGAAAVDLGPEEANLTRVNEALWVIEDDIRDEERAGRFGERFIELARAVYITNDERAAIKKRINTLLGSSIVEEKSYKPYKPRVSMEEYAKLLIDGGVPLRRTGRARAPAACSPRTRRRPQVHDRRRQADRPRRIPRAHRQGARAHGQARHRRAAHRARRIAGVFHRRAVVAQRTPHRRRAARARATSPSSRRISKNRRCAKACEVPAEVRVWNEDEDPLATVAGILRDRKCQGPVARRRDRALLRGRRPAARDAARGNP